MDNIADVTMNGETTTNYFGNSVSSAGDVNGDGFDDVIVGAMWYGGGTGRAYIFYGGAVMDPAADIIMTGEGGYFGTRVSTAGDVNGDGFSDVIVGAYRYGSSSGKVYLYYGGNPMNSTADLTIIGEESNSLLGMALATAGDLNRDGYSDIIMSAAPKGKAYVFFGGLVMDNIPDVTVYEETPGENFAAVSSGGDINGDGYLEFIVGAQTYNSSTGKVYVYDYKMTGEVISDLTMTGEAVNDYFGNAVSSAGDVNGDGYSDVIVGAPQNSSNPGKAYIFFGGALMNNTADITITGEATNNYFGGSVSSAGDVNRDGYADVIVGAMWYGGGIGRAYIYFGGASMNNVADVTMTGEGGYYGVSVSTAGDVNGDTCSDVVVGAYRYGSSAGRAYIYFGGVAMNNVADVTMTGEEPNALFGMAASTAGDVNGDGYSDVLVGAAHDFVPADTGKTYIFFGGTTMDNIADVIMNGEQIADDYGASVSSAGDMNGDGFSDVVVGAATYNYIYSSQDGRAYIYFGGALMNNTADVIMYGEPKSQFGIVSSAGDVNGDGYSDVIIGAGKHDSITGKAYIYFGGAQMNNEADVTMIGEVINSEFGASVSSAGDVNGDGFSDVIVGAPKYNSNTGRAYIFIASAIGSPVNKSFRSKVSRNWNSPLTWEMSTNGGSNWIPATSSPNNSSGTITIKSSHTITVTQNDSAYQIVVENGGQLTVNSLDTFRINSLNNGGILSVNGTLISEGTIEYNGTSTQTLVTTNVNYTNLTINNPAGVTVPSNFSIPGLLSILNGSLNLNGDTITLLDTARLLETPGNTVRGNSGSITTRRNINQPNSLNIAGLGAVITSSENFGLTTITREHNIENVNTGKPGIKRNFTIKPQNNTALNAYLIFKYDTSELDTLNESSLSLYRSTNGGANYIVEGGSVDTANNQIALNYVQSFSRWTAARDSNVVHYGSELVNDLYAKGKLCVRWGSLDTISARIKRYDTNSINVNYVIKQRETPFDIIFETIFTIPRIFQADTLIFLRMPLIVDPGPHSVIVQAIPDELDPINGFDIQTYCFDVTCDAFSYIEPCDTIDGGAGFDGSKGRMVAGFTNLNSSEVFPIHAIDQSFLDSGLGNVPYKLAIYADNGSGKPGNALYISAPLITPPRSGSVETVTHQIDPPVNIPPGNRFYVGYIQTSTTNIRASFQDEIPVRNNVFFFSSDTNGVWFDFADSSKNFRLDISPRTSTSLTLSAGGGTICGFAYTLNLTSIIEGFYDASSDMMVNDTAKAYLRNVGSPYAIVDSSNAVLNSSGVGAFNFYNAVDGTNYYIVVTHRNSIETWSKTTPAFAGGSFIYNFTTADTQAYGDNMKQVDVSPITFAIYSGDVNQDGIVDGSDGALIDNDAANFVGGYVVTDVNGDNFIDGSDAAIADNNAANFVSAMRP